MTAALCPPRSEPANSPPTVFCFARDVSGQPHVESCPSVFVSSRKSSFGDSHLGGKDSDSFQQSAGNTSLSRPTRSLRTHQAQIAAIVQAIAAGQGADITDILAAITPGGGKSLLPVIASATSLSAGVIDQVCWVVPRDSLRLTAEEAFAGPILARCHRPCRRREPRIMRLTRAGSFRATSPPTRVLPPLRICTLPNSSVIVPSWRWTRCTIARPCPTSPQTRWLIRQLMPSPAGGGRSCRCWRPLDCGFCFCMGSASGCGR